MSAERKPVDVLEVMRSDAADAQSDRRRYFGRHAAHESAEESDAAIAAVAELIEADVKFDVAFHNWMHDKSNPAALDALSAAADVRCAALAACRGGADRG